MQEKLQELSFWYKQQNKEIKRTLAARIIITVTVWLAMVAGLAIGIYQQTSKPNPTFPIVVFSSLIGVATGGGYAVLSTVVHRYYQAMLFLLQEFAQKVSQTLGTANYSENFQNSHIKVIDK